MSYAAGAALQGAVYRHLRADTALAALVGDAIFDAMPVDVPAGVHVSLGPEEARDAGDATGRGSQHDFVVSVLSGSEGSAGFSAVKIAAAAVAEALETGGLMLDRGHLVAIWFRRARARRVENGAARRVDLTFRALIDLG
ncbi:DUF3168 domain-containing protein [Paracoccus marinaquae]|uniref:DUF3168 domain-containing protein n=1 Tax=Paracoccus marinaquae TaxID=2841926 RepID=A0ABS6ALC7_9RHOB|nr:DUF3168 domain-containing protein [Paracoccus marinaquae]MBU3031294.1 DUF3168 domain-containing protein [Paracoccus marinaquae]